MRKLSFVLLILFIAFVVSDPVSAQDNNKATKDEKVVKNEEGKPVNTVCPVSTEDVDKEITYEYKGKTYALCCNSCLKKFKKDPEKYIQRLSEDGKSIVKNKEK